MIATDASSIAAAIRAQVPTGNSLFAIVDACQSPELVALAKGQLAQPARMLFKGAAASVTEIESVAPYFFPVDLSSDFLDRWCGSWGKNVGVLMASSAEPRIVFRHLRAIFVVRDEGGQEHFFRFYDPRVLRVYLPTCTESELIEFFGPIDCFLSESEAAASIANFALASGKLRTSMIELTVGI